MSGLEVFVLIVVPGAVVLMCAAGLWLQARANRAVKVHVKRLDELNAAAAGAAVLEQPTAHSTPPPKTPIRAAGQFSLPLTVWLAGGISGQSRILP
jgi:hypothetical protein